MTETNTKSDLKRVAGCWLKTSKKGVAYMSVGPTSGDLPAGAKLLMFRNRGKDPNNPADESKPDYELFVPQDETTNGDS